MFKEKSKEAFDLGTNPVKSLFVKIWIPTMISMMIAGTFLVFDTIFVSHGFHAGQLANEGAGWYWSTSKYSSLGPTGVSYAMPYTLIMISTSLMIGGGVAAKATMEKAKQNKENTYKTINSFLPIVIFYGLILSVFLILFAKVLVWLGSGFQKSYLDNWFNNPLINKDWAVDPTTGSLFADDAVIGHLLSQSSWYIRIQGLAAIPYLYMSSSGLVLRIEGKTHIASYVNVIALGTNIVLDVLLVNVFGLNLVGAAIATIAAETIGMILFFSYFRYKFPIRADHPNWQYAKQNLLGISKLGTSTMGLYLNSALILLVVTTSIGFINYNDMEIINGYTSAFQTFFSLYMLSNLIVIGTTVSFGPIVTYNVQVNKVDRAKEARNIGFKIIIGFSIFMTIFIVLFPVIVTTMFNTMPFAKGYPQRISQILMSTFFFGSMLLMSGVYFQSIGENKKANFLIYIKPFILWPLVLILGFSIANGLPNSLASWSNSVLPWNEDIGLIDGRFYSLGLFYGVPVTDIILGSIAIFLLARNKKDVDKNGFQYIKN